MKELATETIFSTKGKDGFFVKDKQKIIMSAYAEYAVKIEGFAATVQATALAYEQGFST